MQKRSYLPGVVFAILVPLCAIAAGAAPAPPSLTANEVVAKNVAARGGLLAWRAVQTMSFEGKMDGGGKTGAQLPFSLELKRPRKSRLEIQFADDTAVQVYDGANGWKLRPYLGRKDIESFSSDELRSAAMESDLDGPLVDYELKGTKVELAGVEQVEGRDAYKLKLTLRGGHVRRLWIDAKTFLEAKIEGTPRRLDGVMHPVEIYYRDYRPVNGLMVPFVLETVVEGLKPGQVKAKAHKMTIEKVAVNPKVEDLRFTRPSLDAAIGKGKPTA